MACVLTAAIVRDGRATIGHVGDTRLYKLRGDRIEKITRDHSPVGEREDANEISEAEAMRHPRRNEVYRDVGSEPHEPDDPEFVDIEEIAFEPDAALLICSDGLTDLVTAAAIARIVRAARGRARGGRRATSSPPPTTPAARTTSRRSMSKGRSSPARRRRSPRSAAPADHGASPRATAVLSAVATFALLQPGAAAARWSPPQALPMDDAAIAIEVVRAAAVDRRGDRDGRGRVRRSSSNRANITSSCACGAASASSAACRAARPSAFRLTATDVDPAVVASGVTDAEFAGFRIVGDAATPLGVGVFATDASRDDPRRGNHRRRRAWPSTCRAAPGPRWSAATSTTIRARAFRFGPAPRRESPTTCSRGTAPAAATLIRGNRARRGTCVLQKRLSRNDPRLFGALGTRVGDRRAATTGFLGCPRPASRAGRRQDRRRRP